MRSAPLAKGDRWRDRDGTRLIKGGLIEGTGTAAEDEKRPAVITVTVVIPTYNESENVLELLSRLDCVFRKHAQWHFSLVLADDCSPDRTADLAVSSWTGREAFQVSCGSKKGLGCAYLRGFEVAVSDRSPDIIVMMDGDLSHPPERIPALLDALESGADIAIGCRYMPGGGTPDWNWRRRLLSRFGNWVARKIGKLDQIRDCTSGFRAFKTELLTRVEVTNLHTRGYAFLTTLLYELQQNGEVCQEVPLVFYDRRKGKTKLDLRDIVEFGFNALRLWIKGSQQLWRFLTVGLSGVGVNLGALFLLVELFGLGKHVVAPMVSVELSILSNFVLNDRWTFRNCTQVGEWWERFTKYHLVALSGLVLNLGIYNSVLYLIPLGIWGYEYLVAQMVAIGVVFAWNYVLSIRWTWYSHSALRKGGNR